MFNLNKISRYQAFMLGIMSILLQINETLLFTASDTLLVTHAGPEALSFLRMWIILPAVFLTLMLYKALMKSQRKELNFYFFIGLYVAFVMFFNLVLYPHHDQLTMDKIHVDALIGQYPAFNIFFKMMGGWIGAVYYCVAVLWSKIVFGFILWRLADDVVWKKKKVFPIIGLWLSLGTIISNFMARYIINLTNDWGETLSLFSGLFCATGLGIAVLYNLLNFEFKRHSVFNPIPFSASPAEQEKRSLRGTLKFALENKVVFSLLMIVVFAVIDNVLELVWKFQIRAVYPTQEAYASFNTSAGILSGFVSVAGALVAMYVMNHCSFRTSAYAPPVVFLTGASVFFASIYFSGQTILGIPISGDITLWTGAVVLALNVVTDYRLMYPTFRLMYKKMDKLTEENSRYAFEMYGKNIGSTILAFSMQILLAFWGVPQLTYVFAGIVVIYCLMRLYFSRRFAQLMGV